MKSGYNNFLFIPLCLLGSVFLFSEKANAVSCSAGNYPYLSWCHGCVEGCYCKGPGFYQGAGYLGHCDPANGTMKFGAIGKSSGWNDVYTCPKDFPKSKSGAKSAEDCYTDANGKVIYNKSVKCDPGKYLPAQEAECFACKNDGKSICAGGTFHVSLTKDQGINDCQSGLVPNSDNSACEKPDTSIKIDARTYLPADSSTPAACQAGYYCPGMTVEKVQPFDQGIEECPENSISKSAQAQCDECPKGTKANADHTACEEADIPVNPGYYLRANSVEPVKCTTAKKYCPGGDFRKSSKIQGIFDCPYNSSANDAHTGCILDLTQDQMRIGLYGSKSDISSQCWVKTDPNDYKKCVFGGRFNEDY